MDDLGEITEFRELPENEALSVDGGWFSSSAESNVVGISAASNVSGATIKICPGFSIYVPFLNLNLPAVAFKR